MKTKFTLISLLIFFVSVQSYFDIRQLHEENNKKILVCQEVIDRNYQLMKDVHEIFEFYGIEYWIQGGMLVGALRHGGMIPWDDDLDINISSKDMGRVIELKPLFEKLGYYVKLSPSLIIKIGTKGKCLVDVFGTKHSGNKTTYLSHWWKREGKPLYLYDEELYPLRLYQFGPVQVWGPNNPFEYLRCGFKDNYMERVVIYNHKIRTKFECRFAEIDPEFQTHVLPSHPLQDRVAQLNLNEYKV